MSPSSENEKNDLLHQATHDELTGLLNRGGIAKHIENFIGEKPGQFGVLLVDLDGLKRVNDTEGHLSGDRLITRAAATFKQTLRHERNDDDNDTFGLGRTGATGRVGGDEFVLVIAGTDLASVQKRLRQNLAEAGVNASIGGKVHEPGMNITELMAAADDAMYTDKEQRKLEQYSAEQLETVRQIGILATEQEIELRDIASLFPMLASLDQDTEA